MAENIHVVLLMIALFVAGFLMTFNMVPYLNLSFSGGAVSIIYTIILRIIVSPLLMLLSVWVSYKVLTE